MNQSDYEPTEEQSEEDKKNKKKKNKKKKGPTKFPWWCKILAYILCFIFASVSVFFIVIKGISLGDETVQKWITSTVISLFTSVCVTQPLQVQKLFIFLFEFIN